MKRVVGQVLNGEFVSGKPAETGSRERRGLKEFNRLHSREQFGRDLVQPWKHGQPNEEYIEAFGKEEAIRYFGEGIIPSETD